MIIKKTPKTKTWNILKKTLIYDNWLVKIALENQQFKILWDSLTLKIAYLDFFLIQKTGWFSEWYIKNKKPRKISKLAPKIGTNNSHKKMKITQH
jgi:hypothetical protein